MLQEFYSIEQVAARLGLHVRTVRNYVRKGRLKAVRIGKQYRVSSEALESLTGRPVETFDHASVRRHRHVEASTIVEIDALDSDSANRITNSLMAAANGPRRGGELLRVQTIYEPERARLKIIVIGGLNANAEMFKLINVLVEACA